MATQIEKNTEKLIQRKLDILFAKQQQLNNNAGGQQQKQYAMGGPTGGGIFNSGIIPKIIGNRNKYYKENLGNQQANVDMMNAYHTPIIDEQPWIPIIGNTPGGWKRVAENNKQVQTRFEQQFMDTYGRIPTSKDKFMMNQRATELLPKKSYGGYLPQAGDGWDFSNINIPSSGMTSSPMDVFKKYTTQQFGAEPTGYSPTNPFDTSGINPYNYQNKKIDNYKPDPIYRPDSTGGINLGSPTFAQGQTLSPGFGVSDSLKYTAPNAPLEDIQPVLGSLNEQPKSNVFFSNPKDNPDLPGFKPTPASAGAPKPGPDWGKVGTMAGQIAPMIYNMAMGLKKPDKVKPNYNPYEGQIRSMMANRRFNIDPLLTANRTANAVANRNVRNVANSRGEMMGNFGANQNYRMGADAAAWAQKNNMDNQYMGEQAQMDYGLGNNRAQMDWNVQQGNAANKAATQQYMGQGFNDLGRFAQTQQLMNNQMKNSQQLAGIYQDVYGGMSGWMTNINKILNSLPNTKVNGQ
jgi:hypothetical protein